MTKWMPAIVAGAIASVGVLFAQLDLTGAWQGTMTLPNVPQGVRVIFRISKDASGLSGRMYSIDQDAQARAATVTLTGTVAKISVPSLAGMFLGKLDSDGSSLTGTWTQGNGAGIPLTLKRAGPGNPEWPIPETGARPKALTDPNPEFDACSIKLTDPATAQGKAFRVRGQEFAALNRSAGEIMSFVYGINDRQIAGAPGWFDTEMYDVVGKPAGEGKPNMSQWKIMLQKVLANRFGLSFHKEQRELQVYAIQVGKDGPKLTRSAGDPNGNPDLTFPSLGVLRGTNASLADLVIVLQGMVLDKPVVDQSGIAGKWDFLLQWTPDETQFPGIAEWHGRAPASNKPDAPPDLLTAFSDELGLKLAATRAPMEVFVIDHVEKPSAN